MDSERSAYCDLVRSDLIGPANGANEVLSERPDKRYLMGMLFPQDAAIRNATVDEEDEMRGSEAAIRAGWLGATGWVLASAHGGPLAAWPLWCVTAVTAVLVWRTKIHLLWLLSIGAVLGALGVI